MIDDVQSMPMGTFRGANVPKVSLKKYETRESDTRRNDREAQERREGGQRRGWSDEIGG